MNRASHRTRLGFATVGSLIGLVALISGCSMGTGLTHSTGQPPFVAEAATLDVLAAANIPIQVAPVCTEFGAGPVTCTDGQTESGQKVAVDVIDPKTHQMRVTVGDRVIFEGSGAAVMEKAGRVDQ